MTQINKQQLAENLAKIGRSDPNKDWARKILLDQKGRATIAIEMACRALGVDASGKPKIWS